MGKAKTGAMLGKGKSKPKSNALTKSRIAKGGNQKKQPKAKGKGPGQRHEKVMTGPGSPY